MQLNYQYIVNMKEDRTKTKILRISALLVCVMALFAGCSKTDFEEELLYGTWYCAEYEGGFYYTFNHDHTGSFQDKNGDGLSYTWTLSDEYLDITVKGSGINVAAIETYVIESLSANKLVWYDQNDPSRTKYTYTK